MERVKSPWRTAQIKLQRIRYGIGKLRQPSKAFPFLMLPAEVRNMIYVLLICSPQPFYSHEVPEDVDKKHFLKGESTCARHWVRRKGPFWRLEKSRTDGPEQMGFLLVHGLTPPGMTKAGRQIQLLRACKQVCKEALCILYTENEFVLTLDHRYNFSPKPKLRIWDQSRVRKLTVELYFQRTYGIPSHMRDLEEPEIPWKKCSPPRFFASPELKKLRVFITCGGMGFTKFPHAPIFDLKWRSVPFYRKAVHEFISTVPAELRSEIAWEPPELDVDEEKARCALVKATVLRQMAKEYDTLLDYADVVPFTAEHIFLLDWSDTSSWGVDGEADE